MGEWKTTFPGFLNLGNGETKRCIIPRVFLMQISLLTLSKPPISQRRKIHNSSSSDDSHSCSPWKCCFITALNITHLDFLRKKGSCLHPKEHTSLTRVSLTSALPENPCWSGWLRTVAKEASQPRWYHEHLPSLPWRFTTSERL